MVTDCTIRYEQELTEWEEAVEEVEQDCDQKLKLVYNFAVITFAMFQLPVEK